MNKKTRNIIIGIVVAVVVVIAAWFGFGPGLGKKQANKVVTVGVVGEGKPEVAIWNQAIKTAKDKYGVTIKIKNFTDYNQPNNALKNGDIDLNSFQHYAFLAAWNKANHGDLVAIGKTSINPIRLYSKKYHKLSDIPEGATIAVPNDASNESRALYLLKNAKLISLRPKTKLAIVADIVKNPRHLKIKEVGGEQCARVITSVAAAVVNNTFALPAGLGDKETLFVEPTNQDSRQWINIICARKSQAKNPAYQAVVKSYQTAATKKLYKKYYGNRQIAAWDFTPKNNPKSSK
ncbi:MetQ/NlpA family ABC transporter substrate-binding protein [Lactobacillus sp. ESL0791]|uniref:MetQ/NlpA family ABC transporter substrate-binding protein n=1 Tax=Lactobacillus sp. ESL0791 TaxID=2983234 RepID=UPI0023F9EF3F|nr:MetQ/NlpA family ABC transporter substrate-binding protein [Lactobacillus sp. ESL0791]MDF7637931.1 MetQ/NlpA family ABC transporter substrate-binding protein [Lactobacillus sp. ESL0791]